MTSKGIAALASSPISPKEFYHAFTKLWTTWEGCGYRPPSKIGLAISGGSDSMALAYLCSQLTTNKDLSNLEVKAYVVDHKYRPESSQEARLVADHLEGLGLKSEVLTIHWDNEEALVRKGFETQARILRYQILGKACAFDNVRALFLGHHQDDNVETALMRLAQGHRKLGLVGFDEIAPIPESHGLYGVNKSGLSTSLDGILNSTNIDGIASGSNHGNAVRSARLHSEATPFSTGGIHLFRPFRLFPKSRLVATCQENDVPFVTDSTNEDHTFTMRNTVRRLLDSEDSLPQALQKSSILSLVEKSRQHSDKFHKLCDKLLQRVKVLNFDHRFGTLSIQLPAISDLYEQPENILNKQTTLQTGVSEIYASVMRALCDLVSPYPDRWSQLSQLIAPSSKVFLGFKSDLNCRSFTVGGVLWQGVKLEQPTHASKSPSTSLPVLPGNLKDRPQDSRSPSPCHPNIWLLSRQPIQAAKPPPTSKFALKLPDCTVSSMIRGSILQTRNRQAHLRSNEPYIHSEWTDWQLWDNRYWIRIRGRAHIQQQYRTREEKMRRFLLKNRTLSMPSHTSDSPLLINLRHSHQADLTLIKRILGVINKTWAKGTAVRGPTDGEREANHMMPSDAIVDRYLSPQRFSSLKSLESEYPTSYNLRPSDFQQLLALLAPGKIRFTLPILTASTPEDKENGDSKGLREQLLGLPTLPLPILPTLLNRTPVVDAKGCITDSTFHVLWQIQSEMRYKWINPDTVRAVFGN